MAFIQMNVFSKALMRTVPVNVILPADKMVFPGMPAREDKPYKTLYLLHGIFGNYTDWINGTRIQRYAEEHDLVVVMPSGDNAFYVDQPKSNNRYGEFVGKELPELTRKIFPLSHRREDTFIGGLSMGGYGAIRNGLKYNDTFGYVVALSAALITERAVDSTNEGVFFIESKDYLESCFGDLNKLLKSDMNPKYLVEQLINEKKDLPEFFMACGDQDSLLNVNVDFAEFLKENNAKIKFEVGSGNHDWDFWDSYIKKVIEWLPTEKAKPGLNSGNIGELEND